MTASELKRKYLDFFVKKGHQILPNVSLVPENDPSVLFTTAGMHPLVPYLLGETHPLGKRLCGLQRCLRTDDIDEVGDAVHHTFFEMLGNWSLGDYWKKESLSWSFEFLTSERYLGIPREKLAVTVFAGDNDAPFDKESYDLWIEQGISSKRIAKLPKKNNWWGPVGQTGPCGPDSEMFYWTGKDVAPAIFDPNDSRWVEIWNDVFMEFNKKEDGTYKPLKQKNVDTGMGLERTLAVLNRLDDDYKTDLFWPIIEKLEELSGKKYEENLKEFRIVADHLKASVMLIVEGVLPGRNRQEAVLKRLIRDSLEIAMDLEFSLETILQATDEVVTIYKEEYPSLIDSKNKANNLLSQEWHKLDQIKKIGPKIIKKTIQKFGGEINEENARKIIEYHVEVFGTTPDDYIKEIGPFNSLASVAAGTVVFSAVTTSGLPLNDAEKMITPYVKPLFVQKDERNSYNLEIDKHKNLSRTASEGMFKGGLADHSEESKKYHTAAHLLHAALREVLGTHVRQAGQNITAERLRFDFTHSEKLTADQLKKVEDLINQKIKENRLVKMEIMALDQAKNKGALAFFEDKYKNKVKVYSINDFSKEVCGGPHVGKTGEIGSVKIIKEEAVGSGKRRIYTKLAQIWK